MFTAARDFNHANLTTVLNKFHRSVTCATRGSRTLIQVHTNVARAYKAQVDSRLGQSDHLSIFLYSLYQPRIRTVKPITKPVRFWPEDAVSRLQDCFDNQNAEQFLSTGRKTSQ